MPSKRATKAEVAAVLRTFQDRPDLARAVLEGLATMVEDAAKGGRPKAPISVRQVEKLAEYEHTDREIAAVLGVNPDTLLERKRSDPEIAAALERGRMKGTASIRRKQYQLAIKGNVTMLVWLGKNRLGQTDALQLGTKFADLAQGAQFFMACAEKLLRFVPEENRPEALGEMEALLGGDRPASPDARDETRTH